MHGSSAIDKSSKCLQEFRILTLELCKSKKEGIVKSKLLEGLEINSKDVFE